MLSKKNILKNAPKRDFSNVKDEQCITSQDIRGVLRPIEMPTMDSLRNIIYEIQDKWDDHKFSYMVDSCQRECLKNIVTPFGLGKFISSYDKLGGNITTVHNAKQGIYANPETEGLQGDQYRTYKFQKARQEVIKNNTDQNGNIIDGYTGKKLSFDDVDIDHNTPVKKMHTEQGGFIQSEEKRAERGADQRNLIPTSSGLNRSMQDKDIIEWMNLPSTQEPHKTNAEFYQVDHEKVKEAVARAEEANKEHSPDALEWTQYGLGRSLATGLREAGKMGLQQATGIMLVNFFEGLFFEAMDSYRNGFAKGVNKETFFAALEIRVGRIVRKIIEDWESVLEAFKQGAFSGFMSNLLTSIMNIFFTTSRRLVRMLREGFFSLIQAFKTLFSPAHASLAEAADAALKIIITGAMVGIGIMLEEAIAETVQSLLVSFPPLETIAPLLIASITGGLMGIITTLAIYLIDKLDFFGVQAGTRDSYVLTELEQVTMENVDSIEKSFAEIAKMPSF